jgi:hypothetical protein
VAEMLFVKQDDEIISTALSSALLLKFHAIVFVVVHTRRAQGPKCFESSEQSSPHLMLD